MKITGLPSDSFLTNIGSLLKGSGYKEWLIKVNHSKGKDGNNTKGIKFSNAPALCRGRMYSNDSDDSKKGPVFEFTIDDLENWSDVEYFHASYFESPAPIVLSSVGASNTSAICHIPKFELARVLFFYNEYLATSSLQGRALDIDFRTELNGEHHTVEVFDHCTLTPKDFKDEVLRSQLAWLLLNEEMRQSYDSISKCLMHETRRKNDYENWVFNFTPPPLKKMKIKARFYKNKNNIYRVDEILSITNLTSDISADVLFTGEHFVDKITSTNPSNEVPMKPQSKDYSHTIDDASDADIDRGKQIIMTPQVALQFQDPIKTSIAYKKIRSRKGPKLVDEQDIDDESKTTVVATDEATTLGNVPKGDFRNIKDNSDQTINNAKDFKSFTQLLERFATKHHTDFSQQFHDLPKVKHCRRHMTKGGRPRIMMEARLQYANQRFSIFEVYTADIDTRLSTLIVKVNSYAQLEHKMPEFMTSIVKGSISWKDAAAILNDSETLRHPIGFYEKEFDERMLQKWLKGLEGKFISFQPIKSD